MEIITGYTGKPHITSEQDRDINIGIFGEKSYVLQTGMQMKAEILSNNEIKIRDGVLMHQGCAASIKKNTYDSVTITNGSQGMKRIDLIVARYEKNENTNVESVTWKVLQGNPTESDPEVPDCVVGDIQAGDAAADMPMYRVKIEGLNIVAVEQLFEIGGVAPETVDPMQTTELGFAADAYKTRQAFDEQNEKLCGFEPIVDETGKITGYKTSIGGADTVFPFNGDTTFTLVETYTISATGSKDYTFSEDGDYLLFAGGNCSNGGCDVSMATDCEVETLASTNRAKTFLVKGVANKTVSIKIQFNSTYYMAATIFIFKVE